jgi:hypothetical protein
MRRTHCCAVMYAVPRGTLKTVILSAKVFGVEAGGSVFLDYALAWEKRMRARTVCVISTDIF